MSRDWKPGDVAMVTVGGRSGIGLRAGFSWSVALDGYTNTVGDDMRSSARPLVVIDPEDREQVASLMGIYYRDINGQPVDASAELVDQMQAALRELANPTPPKPDEPTGWLARVADDKGDEYVRTYEHGYLPWVAVCHTDVNGAHLDHMTHRHWGEIAAVRVLSEGVQP